jgi:riboflavin synthase
MFTGIIEALGTIAESQAVGGDRRMLITAPAGFFEDSGGCGKPGIHAEPQHLGVLPGDSIAVNGVCLTAVEFRNGGFVADLSAETLNATTAKNWIVGKSVNLERALTPSKPLGGHLVSGHVDGVGRLIKRFEEARSWRMSFEVPKELSRYVARKGSICIDGVSLTVNEVSANTFGVNIVPHTMTHTTLGSLQEGDTLNLEVDQIARYLERLLAAREEA